MFIGPNPYQKQSSKSEINQVVTQALVACLLLGLVFILAWLQARAFGGLSGPLLLAICALIVWAVIERSKRGIRISRVHIAAMSSAALFGGLLTVWPVEPLGQYGDGRLWITLPLPAIYGLPSSTSVHVAALLGLSLLNVAVISVALLTALRMIIEIIYPNLLNSIRARGGIWPGLPRWWRGVDTPATIADDDGADVDTGEIRRVGVRSN